MGFQHMTKAARRRIQSKGWKATRAKRKNKGAEDVAKHMAVHERFVKSIALAADNGRRDLNQEIIDASYPPSLRGFVKIVRDEERERIKAAILRVIG